MHHRSQCPPDCPESGTVQNPGYTCVRDSKKDENELWTCPFCNNKSITRNNYIRHLSVHKGGVDGFPLNPNPNPIPTVGRSGSVLQVTNRNIIG